MTVVEKAKELGLMLAQSKEFIRMRTAEQAQIADPESQRLLQEYDEARRDLVQRASSENVTPEELQQIRDEMESEQEKLKTNSAIAEYLKAVSDFNNLMQDVNSAIAFYISPEGSCGGDCGGCECGCH